MKNKIREILSKYRQNEGYTMKHAESELLNLFSVSKMLPDLGIDKAEELAWETDYACFAVEEADNEINKSDAGAFFLEGYNYAKVNIR